MPIPAGLSQSGRPPAMPPSGLGQPKPHESGLLAYLLSQGNGGAQQSGPLAALPQNTPSPGRARVLPPVPPPNLQGPPGQFVEIERAPTPSPAEMVKQFAASRPIKLMSNDEVAVHKRYAQRMIQEGKAPAEIVAYMDAAGVPRKKKVDYSPDVTPQYILGAVTSAMHGATFGWDDEAVGSLFGLVTGNSPQAGRDAYRRHLQAFHDENPTTDLALQIAAGIGTGGALPRALGKLVGPKALQYLHSLPGAGIATQSATAKVLTAAAAGGAAYAAGEAQGGVGERLAAVPGGAATGAVFGGAMTGGLIAAGRTLRPILKNMPLPFKGKLFKSAGDEADETILWDLQQDRADLSDMIAKAKKNALAGQPATLGDLAGENTRGRMAGIQAMPGPGKHTLKEGFTDRQMDSGDRLLDWLKGHTKLGLQNVEDTRDGLLGARSLQGEVLYEDAYKLSAPMTDKLKVLFQNPTFKTAWNTARKLLREEKGIEVTAIDRPFYPLGWQSRKPGLAGPAEEILPTELPIAGLDWTKRYLDKVVRAGFNKDAGLDHGVASAINKNLKAALEEIDQLVPQYGLARRTWRGDSEVIDALDAGRTFLKTSADDIQIRLRGASDAEREAFKLGAIEDIRDAIYGKTAKAPDVAQGILGGKENTRRLKELFGADADEFLDRVKIESRFAETLRSTAHGSRTTPLSEVIKNWEKVQAAGVLGNLGAGRPLSALVGAARMAGGRFKATHFEQVTNEMAERYTRGLQDPAHLIGYLLNLQSRKPPRSWLGPVAGAIGGQSVAGQR